MASMPTYNLTPPWDLTVKDGRKGITTAGTREQLAANVNCHYVIVQANSANTNGVWVGGATVASGRGIRLAPTSAPLVLYVTNLNQVWVDTDTNGNEISYLYYAR